MAGVKLICSRCGRVFRTNEHSMFSECERCRNPLPAERVNFEFEPWIETASATPDMFGYGPDDRLLLICKGKMGKGVLLGEVMFLGFYEGQNLWIISNAPDDVTLEVTCWMPAPTLPSEGGAIWRALK